MSDDRPLTRAALTPISVALTGLAKMRAMPELAAAKQSCLIQFGRVKPMFKILVRPDELDGLVAGMTAAGFTVGEELTVEPVAAGVSMPAGWVLFDALIYDPRWLDTP